MNIVSNELTKKFMQDKYTMNTGSDEWQDIKGDFEMEGDAVMGVIAHEDYYKSLKIDKITEFKIKLEKFKIRVDNYSPKDRTETKEKQILSDKVKIGLEIYTAILGKNYFKHSLK